MISQNACYWIWITLSVGYNNPKVKRIAETYSDVSAFYCGGISEWRLCGIFSQRELEKFSSTRLEDAQKIIDRCIECNYSIICIDDKLFPTCLYNIECPPARNRIIAALSDGLLVMEAGKKSGSLITANLAAEQGKTIFALLGNNSPQNEGSNTLIKEGLAIPVTDFMDILCEFDNLYATDDELDIDNISLADTGNFPVKGIRKQAPARIYVNKQNDEQTVVTEKSTAPKNTEAAASKPVHKENLNLPQTAQDVYEYIGNEPVHIDKISADLNIPVFKVLTALTMLEMKGLVSALQGRNYILK